VAKWEEEMLEKRKMKILVIFSKKIQIFSYKTNPMTFPDSSLLNFSPKQFLIPSLIWVSRISPQKWHHPVNNIRGNTYSMQVTPPRSRGTEKIGLEVRIGLNTNLQPKQRAESLKKLTVMMGRSNMCGGSM